MSDFEDDADGWSDYEGDQNDMADEAFDDLEENVDSNDFEAVDGNAEVEQYVKIRKVLSLKENCLECITKNFERFNNAYLSSEDEVLRRNLEFLQRVYTSCIIHSLSGKGLLNDRHLEFLVNEHLKELDLNIFAGAGCTLKAIEKRIVLVGHGFTKVSFSIPWHVREQGNSEFLNSTICHLSNVEVLHIPDQCNDTTLKYIYSFCTKLSELDIDGSSNVTNKGLEMLCKGHGEHQTECLIKVLSLRDIIEIDSVVNFLLNNMPYLEVLNYDKLPIILHSMHKEDLKNNTLNNVKKYNLTKLDFMYTSHILELYGSEDENKLSKADILHVCIEVCPKIKTLCINLSTENCLDLISRFSNLENLTVNCEFDITNGQHLELNNFFKSNGIKLRNLQMDGFILSISILIESCPKLEKLVLANVQFQSLEKNQTKEQSSIKRSLKSLRELCLRDITFSGQYAEDSATSILLSSTNLEKLAFKQCKFENSEINTKLARFCEESTLQHLRFHNCNINLALLESIILTCSSLMSLTIDTCENISPDDVLNLDHLRDTTRSIVQIVYHNDESEENSIYSNEGDIYDDYSDYYHDAESDDEYDLDYDSYYGDDY